MKNGEKYLVTTDNFFYGPDGGEYRAAWGTIEVLGDSVLGIKTNARSTNWFVKIGSDDKHIIIAGCQIHYAIKSDKKPDTSTKSKGWTADATNGLKVYDRPNVIYIAE